MTSAARDILSNALLGLVAGLALGVLGAGAYAMWATGGDPGNVGFTTILAFAPWEVGGFREPFRTAVMVGGAVALATTVAMPALLHRRRLTSHGSARWATRDELRRAGMAKRLKEVRGPIYAKLGGPRSRAAYLTSSDIPHSLIAAPTGSGKGVGVVIPTLLTYPGSVICLDVKGENFASTARHRHAIGDRVFRFAPLDPEGRTHRHNPLLEVAAAPTRRRYARARSLAAGLIVAKHGGESFQGGAWDLFAATAVVMIARGTPTIGAIYDALSQPQETFVTLMELAEEAGKAEAPEAAKILHKMARLDSKILSSYTSVLDDGGLSLWADPAVRDATSASDFTFEDLRREPASIYIVVAPNDLGSLAPLIRLMFQHAVAVIQRAEPDREAGEVFPVLFLLDEFVSLGRMTELARAMTTLRGYGGRVMLVVQTLASLRDPKLYGKDGAAALLGNCRMQLFMSPSDEDTPEYVSRAAGDYTRKVRARSWRSGEGATHSERVEAARLLRPEQVRMLGKERVVALVQDMYPIAAHRVTYHQDRHLARLFEAQAGPMPDVPELPLDEVVEGTENEEGAEEETEDAADRPTVPVAAPQKGEEMDEEVERRVYAGLSSLSEAQMTALDGILRELEAARRRRDVGLPGREGDAAAAEGPPPAPATAGPAKEGDGSPAGGDVAQAVAAARDDNRKRAGAGEAPADVTSTR
jgi:type IV secretion system protein VirD4